MKNFINNKIILITGATGSFGSELVTILKSKFKPKNISFLMIIDLVNLKGSAKIRKNYELVSLYETQG